jgi:hypothetical protein
MGGVGRRGLQGGHQHLLDLLVSNGAGRSGPRLIGQPFQAAGHKPRPPLGHRRPRDSQPGGDLGVAGALGTRQHDPAAQRQRLAGREGDTRRRVSCRLPAAVRHRPRWQLALDMLDELDQWGLRPPVLVADAGYGEVGEFRQGLDDRQVPYVVQVKADTSAYPEQTHPTVAPYTGRGRRPQPRYRDKPCSLTQLALAAGQSAGVDLIWRRASKGLQRSRFLALRVRPAGITPRRQAAARADGARWELPVRWLLVEWPTSAAEPVKYWLSNLPETTPLVELVRLGKLR